MKRNLQRDHNAQVAPLPTITRNSVPLNNMLLIKYVRIFTYVIIDRECAFHEFENSAEITNFNEFLKFVKIRNALNLKLICISLIVQQIVRIRLPNVMPLPHWLRNNTSLYR